MTEAGFPDLLKVAKVLKSNGTHGDLLVGFRGILPEDLETEEPVYIYFDGLPVPFFILKFETRGSSRAIMHLMGVDNLKDAEEMVSREIYVDSSLLEDIPDDDPDLIGWTVLDENGANLGTITGIEDIPGNPCIYLRRPTSAGTGTGESVAAPAAGTSTGESVAAPAAGTEVLIPLHEDFILSIDETSRSITMTLPAGLL
ncbi:MAG: hypothetical protein IJS07_02190 [Bacteroidales bacterium]|nr:hypothetical protein [Bacteroidales bacterium]